MIPCVRHGSVGTADEELVALFRAFEQLNPSGSRVVRSLYAQQDREIWVTWDSEQARSDHAKTLTDLSHQRGEQIRHLVIGDIDYDYQEDVPPVD